MTEKKNCEGVDYTLNLNTVSVQLVTTLDKLLLKNRCSWAGKIVQSLKPRLAIKNTRNIRFFQGLGLT